jgi:hypothetical protein
MNMGLKILFSLLFIIGGFAIIFALAFNDIISPEMGGAIGSSVLLGWWSIMRSGSKSSDTDIEKDANEQQKAQTENEDDLFLEQTRELSDEDLLNLINNRNDYNPESIAVIKTVGMERGLINEEWKIIK